MKKDHVSTLTVAATYIGTVVGAGFATGQEILQFFSRFRIMGLAGLLLCTFLFVIFGDIIMQLGRKLHARSHMEIIRCAGGKVVGTVIDLIITVFLFGGLTAMIAGTGALFAQQFHLPVFLGNALMAVLTAVTVLTGIDGVIKSISYVVPFLLAAVVGTSIHAIATSAPELSAAAPGIGDSSLISNWLTAAVLYISYNTIISVAVLGPLGVKARNSRTIRNGAILGGIGLGLGAVMIYFALAGHMRAVAGLEVPMLYIAARISPAVQLMYTVVLIAEIYTTAVGSLYGFAARISELLKPHVNSKTVVITASAAGLVASQFGFSNLVKYLYPLVGYGGIVLLVSLLYVEFRRKKTA